ncbi:hypothetical protein ESA94_11540 [Lacibacter luteus]|uniref:Uncharacterized protein n=1 Tax=Lacibacter luteus TaxID=2508719 RepID=A0A4V1M7F5_9BACT|nr:hypothetical protein [Lacibacter luteus]RXK59692.1 hypothetical protein ESA94_11540 [Lacibacter luteus]
MSIKQMKSELLKELDKADESTIKSMYDVFKMVSQQKNSPSWKDLSDVQKMKIDMGLKQLKEGKGISAKKVTDSLQKKYGIKA